jgi:hypothetical protein
VIVVHRLTRAPLPSELLAQPDRDEAA